MKKALQEDEDLYFTFREGRFSAWSSKETDWFIEAAIKGLELSRKMQEAYSEENLLDPNSELARETPEVLWKVRYYKGIPNVSEEESFCLWINNLLSEYINQGRESQEMIDELNEFMSRIRYRHMLMPSNIGTPKWEYIADLDRQLTPDEIAAFSFSQMIVKGSLMNVKQCQMSDCGHYFTGRPNAKWCSKPCGSKYRVQKKRKKDKSR
jgi:predicted RNA-binding Zn ribbon-like protein